jgi:KaiC/GvpD/RAD55 family RecA-like ATPase
MITKTLSGISMLDEPHGGIFSNRSFLVTGAKHAGKTVMGLQFTRQGLEQNERCLYLSTMLADDLGILAESLGFDLTPHLASENLTLLEYESFMSGGGAPGLDMLPPEGFEQLKDIINANSIERVVLDTVLPWVSVRQPERMAEQVFSFTRSFDRLGVTTMLTLPRPVSSLAYRLKKSIEDIVPISILLQPAKDTDPARLQVVKYLGEKKLDGKRPFLIQDGIGIRELSPEEILDLQAKKQQAETTDSDQEPSESVQTIPDDEQERPSIRIHTTHRPRFSTITFDHTRENNTAASPIRDGNTHARISDNVTPPSPPRTEENVPAPEQPPQPTPAQPLQAEDQPVQAGNEKDLHREGSRPEKTEAPSSQPDTGGGAARFSNIWRPQTDSEPSAGSRM